MWCGGSVESPSRVRIAGAHGFDRWLEDMVLPNRCHFMVLDVQWVEVDERSCC